MNYTEEKSGIEFTNIDWQSNGNLVSDKIRLVGQETSNIEDVLNPTNMSGAAVQRTQFGIDAINIDWNGANLGTGAVINTSGDLLKVVKDAHDDIDSLADTMNSYISLINDLVIDDDEDEEEVENNG